MEKGFKNPISPRLKEQKKKSPWNFESPCYDDRNMISAGDNYGKGFKNPVGTFKASNENSPIPKGKVDTMRVDNIPKDKFEVYKDDQDEIY